MYREKSLLGKINQLCRIHGGYLFLTLMLLSSFLVSICLIGISLEIQEFVNIATRDSDGRIGRIFLFAGLTVFLYAAAMVAGTVLEAAYLNRTEKKLRLLLVGHMLDTKQEAVDSWHSSDVMTRLTVDVERITRLLPQIFGQMACEAIPAVLALIVMLRMNWKMALIMLAVVPCVVLIISLISPFQQKAAEKDMQNEEGNRSYMSEILTHLSLFWVYRMKETAMEETRELYGRKAKSRQSLSILQGITGFLNNFIGFALMFITMGIGAAFAVRGEVTVGTLIAMVQLTNYVLLPINAMSGWMRTFNEVKASLVRIEEILELPVYEKEGSERPESTENMLRSLVVENLAFQYSAKESPRKVLHGANAVFRRGITGIIGESGSGKSTLLKLLLGLYEPECGRICGEGTEGSIPERNAERLAAYVPGDRFLFRGTVRENILMGQKEGKETLEQVLKQANLISVLEQMEGGLDHEVSESGGNLSMGQQQRIALARALYSRKPVLILDEPTANLDPDAVGLFWNTLRAVSADKIIIIVTHNMEIASKCDRVYFLQNGMLKEKAMG